MVPRAADEIPPDLPRLEPRARDTSKRDYGRVLVVGGAVGMAGAPALAGMAALRSGAGLVEVVVPESVVAIAAGFDPCLMTHGLPADGDGGFAGAAAEAVVARAGRADVVAVGPGLGRSPAAAALVARLWADLTQPAVFDADALWALSRIDRPRLARHTGPRSLTPHAGEMLRFVDREGDPARPAAPARPALETAAAALAAEIAAIVVLKGPDTLVTDGRRHGHNASGNPGMATAGCGDVLTGVIAALLCQPFAPARTAMYDIVRLAVWVHGRAGDVAATRVGEVSLVATDVVAGLPAAVSDAVAPRARPSG